MVFPINFAKSSGDYDFVSPVINFTGNAAVIAAGGIGLSVITYMGLKALGFSKIATVTSTAIPVTIATIGVVSTIAGTFALLSVINAIGKDLQR